MGIVADFVKRAQDQLDGAAASSFGAVVSGMSTTVSAMATLAVVLIGVNMILQYRPMSAGAMLVTMIKLVIIIKIGLVWSQFHAVASSVEDGINSIAARLLGSFSENAGSANSLAAAMDGFISDFSTKANATLSNLSWMAGAIMSVVITVSLGAIAAVTALLLVFAKVMVTVYLGIAPVFIVLSMFEATKDYFNKWLQGAISYMLYPLVIATMLGGVIRIVKAYMSNLGAQSVSESVADYLPYMACLIIMILCILCIPMIVSSLSGVIQAVSPGGVVGRAASAGLGAAAMARAGLSAGQKLANSELGKQAAAAASTGATNLAGGALKGGISLAEEIAARTSRLG
ncbi:type IV secretion system protein [Ensifer sp. SL37]|uniref:type IV secretion system protein n=1 Tax=Ensifer sp. SL37 TaxID=2995137 RepID=UPI002273EAFC|nr:type IV secretion system protein [Ensifer sp. SL37]MCY1741011.1 type IV secretion system protein [Ensifer sp. SL37]